MCKHILIPTDGSPVAEHAVKRGVGLAKTLNARVTVLAVVPPFQRDTDVARIAERCLAFPREAAKVAGVVCEDLYTVAEHPWAAVVEVAQSRDCDLIVMS
jgi:nucleotide-binding universal stress UspA family protein